MSSDVENGIPDEAAAGQQAIQTLILNRFSNPHFHRDALAQVLRDPLLGGIYAGFDSLQTLTTSQAGRDMHTGLGLALIAIARSKDSIIQADNIPDFVPDDLGTGIPESISPAPEAEISYAGATVVRGIVSDTLTDFGAYRGRLDTALAHPLYKGISDGFCTLMPQMLDGGMSEETMTAIHMGLDLALMAASAPYEMLSAHETPNPSDFH